jgi:serine/threonine-protein kinase RsbW
MAELPNVRLSLPNNPENVLVVRQALTGVAGCVGLNAIEANDLNTAVTEACNNVVLHAYRGAEGPMEVDVRVLTDAITVAVRDRGIGIGIDASDRQPEPDPDDFERESGESGKRSAGMGIPVIEALSREASFIDRDGGGTEVRMEFAVAHAMSLEDVLAAGERSGIADWGDSAGAAAEGQPSSESVFELRLAPGAIARAVLPRVLSALAARVHFSTDRIADVRVVADVLATNSVDSISSSHLDVGITTAPRSLELRIGPLLTGRGESLLHAAADGSSPVIERLTDTRRVAPSSSDAGETLELRLADRR